MTQISPEPVAHLSQHRLVPMLLSCATSNAVGSSVIFDHTVTDVRQTGDNVTVMTKTAQVCTQWITKCSGSSCYKYQSCRCGYDAESLLSLR